MSATTAPPAGSSSAASPAPAAPDPGGPAGRVLVWLGVGAASLAAFVALTWPLALHMDGIWTAYPTPDPGTNPAARYRPDQLIAGDHLQTVFIQSVVVDNLRAVRNPYLDLREGVAGPAPLKTSSLDLPWTLLLAATWPAVGLVPAYNLSLALASVATGLAAYAWLCRHTRWPLLAVAGALAYAGTPNRLFQLTGHFNALLWWAFPAALLAWEVVLERWRVGRAWRWPGLGLAGVVVMVAASGEYHLILYLAGLLGFLGLWALGVALAGRQPLPLAPLALAAATLATACTYVVAVFAYAFRGDVQGSNGSFEVVARHVPESIGWLVDRGQARFGDLTVYVGWAVVVLAAAGLVVALVGRSRARAARPYAVLLTPLLVLTLGPTADVGPFRPYRFLFDRLPFLSLQRVPPRLMVVTSLVLVLLAVVALDQAAGLLLSGRRWAAWLAAAALLAGTVLLHHDYLFARNLVMRDVADNRVVAALRAAGDGAGPIVGVPVGGQTTPSNSTTTYVAALSRRRALNAYNQTPAPWLPERLRRLRPLNRGDADPAALRVLRQTGTTQVVVVNQPPQYQPGQWRMVVDRLVASGRFRLVVVDGPLALLRLSEG